jgi:protein TonB
MFRPPSLDDGATASAPLIDLAAPSMEVPFPIRTARPTYPPQAAANAVVLVEVAVDREGRVASASMVSGDPGFKDVALEAARGWTFRPAHRQGQPVLAFAYLIFGFRRPVASG